MKQLITLFFLLLFYSSLLATGNDNGGPEGLRKLAQDNKSTASPDFPGTLLIDFGFNFLHDEPDDMELGFWGSKIVNIYYMSEIQLGESRFSINPGFGVGLEKYSFDNDITLQNDPGTEQVALVALEGFEDIKKSKLAANYFDIPVELRFHLNKDDFKKSLKFAIGGKAGILFSAHTKIKFEEDDETKKIKDKETFELNRIRYGVQGRIGIGSFNVFYYQELSELFSDGNGPEGTDANSFKIGVSFGVF